jgi:hypothetical protein
VPFPKLLGLPDIFCSQAFVLGRKVMYVLDRWAADQSKPFI